MEAVPKLPMISFDLKASAETTHFGPKLKQYIGEAYREDPDSYGNEIHQLEGLRATAVRPALDASGLTTMTRYFCQLRAMQSRFPMSKGQPVACTFVWRDLYASLTCSMPDIRCEMACILYNIGALHTQLAAAEARTTPESLKAACTHYQNAAWAFLHSREHYPQPPGMDICTDILRFLQEICFAQAQECILDKSIQDTRKPSVVGAVATQVLFFYRNSIALLGPSTGTDNIHEIIGTKLYNYWYRYLSFKVSYIGCIVCLYQGLNAEEQQKMGERVAFYQQAVDKLAEARKLAKYIEPVQVTQEALTFTNDVVEGKRKAAKNENEFIYHEEVPDKDLLLDLKPVCLVKPLPINFNDKEVSGPDIFSRLVPIGAHEASSVYSEEKAKLLRHVVSQAEAKNTELTEFMSSLQLDQLDVMDSDQKMPQEIVDRCAAMNAKSDIIQTLVDSMNSLAEIISDVEHSLADIKSFIHEETLKEKDYQKVMGPRPPSIVQTELSREFHKYQEAHTRTNESNQVLHKAMTLHIANLRLLAQPLDVLCSKIPSIDNIEGLDRDAMTEMRRVVGKAREMQTQRDSLIQELRDAVTGDDITPQLLARSTESADDIFKQELEKHTPKVKIIEQNLAAQENIINRLTSLYASYGESRRMLADVLRKREGIINALITSYDTYEELLGKSQKGLEFYKKLSSNVGQLLTRLRGTCQVHEEERAQMLAKQNTKAATPVPTPPASVKLSDTPPPAPQPATPGTGTLKLKDYLPYMKSRGMARNATPQAQVESIPSDAYYPESIYPTSVRPTPVGSEASDLTQMKLPDGVVMPSMQNVNPYNRYTAPYAPNETDPYSVPPYAYPATSKGYEKPDDGSNYGYATPYTPPQFSTQIADPQYSNPYYSGTQNNSTIVTDSQIPISNGNQASMTTNNQYVYNDPYAHTQMPQNHMGHIPESMSAYSTGNQMTPELNTNFAQMHVTAPKSEPMNYGSEYSNTFYNVQYPQVSTPNMATYSHAIQNSNTNIVTSQSATDYNSLHYPYSTDPTNQYAGQANVQNPYVANQPDMSHTSNIYVDGQSTAATNYSMPDSQYGYTGYDQGYTLYTNTDSAITSTTSMVNAPLTTSVSAAQPYSTYSNEPDINFPNAAALSQLDAMDTPIKSHVTGEALSNINYASSYQSYDQNAINYPNPMEQNTMAYNQTTMPANEPSYPQTSSQTYQVATSTYAEQTPPVTYAQSYQNHPGYAFNVASGGYDYDYGSQKSYTSYGQPGQPNMDSQAVGQEQNWNPHGVYTSAGACETVQSPSAETPQMPPSSTDQSNSQIYYNTPYGYITAINQSNDVAPASLSAPTNYGADMNQSTYMQSGQKDTSVTYSSNQVSSPIENVTEPHNFDQNIGSNNQNMATINQNIEPSNQNIGSHNQNSGTDIHNNVPNNQNTGPNSQNYGSNFQNTGSSNQNVEPINQNHGSMNQNVAKTKPSSQEVQDTKSTDTLVPEPNPEPTTFDLLSDIDFTVEVKPLMPEIKVPQISENAIKKPVVPKMELIMKPVPKEEVIERPAKMDLFSDPSLMNKFTQEVKNLQKLTDSLTNKTAGGLTVLDSKWKNFQDVQAKENMNRSKRIATQHSGRNVLTDVVPFDDSRLTLKSDPDAYINASYYKQLASWCIPLVISKSPTEREYRTFWRAVLENKISCVVCLLSDIEMQGKTYWPTAIGQSLELSDDVKVTLEDVACTVHWTERKLHVARGKTVLNVTHYQINVFPAKIVCSPLVLLADKILNQTYDNRLSNQLCGAWLQCGAGAGRSAVLALLTMAMCQVRAGQLDLCDMLDTGCINLCKNRTNVLEDTKYLADAYRTVLFYVQGVLCSGTTMFNGEAVSMPTGASVLPPVTPTPTASNQKPQKFSRESFEEMKQSPGLTSGDMKDPLNFLDPLWSLKKK